jgi:YD repeat-containing protein
MLHNLPAAALQSGVRLRLQYDGFSRTVEVHAVGISTAGNPCMRVFQTAGGSVSGESVGWKMMVLDKAFTMHMTEEVSQAPRQGYAKGDRGMSEIFAQL